MYQIIYNVLGVSDFQYELFETLAEMKSYRKELWACEDVFDVHCQRLTVDGWVALF